MKGLLDGLRERDQLRLTSRSADQLLDLAGPRDWTSVKEADHTAARSTVVTAGVVRVAEHGAVVLGRLVVEHIRDVTLCLHRVSNVANDSILGTVKVADAVDRGI